MKPAYYNEIDAYCAAWLRNLIAAGHIPAGEVDTRDIREVAGDDLKGFGACHFFAGIGGWAYAARLAGIDGPIWTGSCPCQPFSTAGKRQGTDDPRHLWPEFYRLISECRPSKVFGEQVASPLGREWLSGVFTDLEALEYAAAGTDLCAAGAGAPQIRQRLWWVAHADGGHASAEGLQRGRKHGQQPQDGRFAGGMGNTEGARLAKRERDARDDQKDLGALEGQGSEQASRTGFWDAYDIIPCGDGKARRVEPGTFPLAHGVSARVGKLRAYGNAIVPQVAAEFMRGCP